MSSVADRPSSTRATLSVAVKANEVIVAEEVVDQKTWQQVLSLVTQMPGVAPASLKPTFSDPDASVATANEGVAEAKHRLAQKLEISDAVLMDACSPSDEEPYMSLDIHCWEQMKNRLPKTGTAGAAPIVAPATLLALWFREAGLGAPTQSHAQRVLQGIGLRDRNAGRSIRNATWLQARAGGQILVNPSEISKAIVFARSFCSKDWSGWERLLESSAA